MTTIYHSRDPIYFDEADARNEMARVFDVCAGCRLCTDLCAVFPSLFDRLGVDQFGVDHLGVDHLGVPRVSADQMTPAEQDAVTEQCYHCTLCVQRCPHAPVTLGEGVDRSGDALGQELDFPALMVRAAAIRRRGGHLRARERLAGTVMHRTELLGAIGVRTAGVTNRLIGAEPGSAVRRVVAAVTQMSPVRLLPPYARERFSTWFRGRESSAEAVSDEAPQVAVFATCSVEYHAPEIGRDLVRVYEHSGISCGLSTAGCCGAPWLHSGDLDRFTALAAKNLRMLAAEVRAGTEIVVPQPTCAMVLTREYRLHLGAELAEDADLVSAHTWDASEYLLRHLESSGSAPDQAPPGAAAEASALVTYHAACHAKALATEDPSLPGALPSGARLIALTGAEVTVIHGCSGTDGLWGLRAGNEATAMARAAELTEQMLATGDEIMSGDCHLANTAVNEQSGRVPMHPLQVVARAWGLAER